MLNKKYSEADVRQLFSGNGTIEECTVLRDASGLSKGCAFVTFGTKQAAISAIKVSASKCWQQYWLDLNSFDQRLITDVVAMITNARAGFPS